MNSFLFVLVLGTGATVLIDIWAIVRKHILNVSMPNYGWVGRWFAYMPRGQFRHKPIGAAPPIRGEQLIGWSAHYLIGIAYAALLVAWTGPSWMSRPTLGPALALGIATVAAPFLLMQPGMGSGIAGARTANPLSTRIHSIVTHTLFGLGLYVAGSVVSFFRS